MQRFSFQPIGVIHSRHHVAAQTPIQPVYAADFPGTVEVFPAFAAGLRDLDGYSHIYLLYVLDRAGEPRLAVKPFLQDVERGVFATRAPCRPNPIGMSIVPLLRQELTEMDPACGRSGYPGRHPAAGHQALFAPFRLPDRNAQRLAGRGGRSASPYPRPPRLSPRQSRHAGRMTFPPAREPGSLFVPGRRERRSPCVPRRAHDGRHGRPPVHYRRDRPVPSPPLSAALLQTHLFFSGNLLSLRAIPV